MPQLDGNLSTWVSILAFAPLVALIWAQLPLQILVHYELGLVGARVVLSIKPWGIPGDRLQKRNMKYGMNSKFFSGSSNL
jgi:hypothetical protein